MRSPSLVSGFLYQIFFSNRVKLKEQGRGVLLLGEGKGENQNPLELSTIGIAVTASAKQEAHRYATACGRRWISTVGRSRLVSVCLRA